MAATLSVYETRTLLEREAFTGDDEALLQVITGARMLATLLVTAIDLGATVTVYADNSFADGDWEVLETFSASAVGRTKRVLSDFHNNFRFRVEVTGGNATFKIGVSLFDNSGTTTIENAQLAVNLNHTLDSLGHFDSIRIGDGVELLGINADGSINVKVTDSVLPDGAATEDKQDVGNASLASIDGKVATAAKQDAQTALLTTIRDNADQVESLIGTGNTSLASIDGKVSTAANQASIIALLTSIRDNADQLEGYLDGVEGLLTAGNASLSSIDGKVATAASQATANALLTQIRDNADQLEGYLDGVEGLLTNIHNNTDGLEALITSTNSLLTTIRDNADQLEGYFDGVETLLTAGNASLSSIDTKVATAANQASIITLLTSIRDNADAVEAKLDTLHADLLDVQTKQDTGNASLSSIDGKVATATKQDTGNTSLASIDGKLTDVATQTTLAALLALFHPSSASVVAVPASTSSVTLKAANASRKGLLLFNDSNSDCYVAFAATASTAAFTVKLTARAFYELPLPVYTGIVTGIWSNANGNMMVTELS